MTATFSVRRAEPEDSTLLSRIGAETFIHTFGPDNAPEDVELYLQMSFSPEIQARELADPTSVFLIAEHANEPVGYARLLESDPPLGVSGTRPIEIVRIYASPERVGRGVGATLMRACLEEAATKQCDTIWLGIWEEDKRAIGFFAKWGFEMVGSHCFFSAPTSKAMYSWQGAFPVLRRIDSSLPTYDAAAADLLIGRVIEFLAGR